MKIKFTSDELLQKKGCYSESYILYLLAKYENKETYSINEILKSEIPLEDKQWFVYSNCNLTSQEKEDLSLQLIWCILPIYENKYPSDNRIKDCLQAIEDFKMGKITIDVLQEKRKKACTSAHVAYDAANYIANYAINASAYAAANYVAYASAYTATTYATAYAATNYVAYASADATAYATYATAYASAYAINAAIAAISDDSKNKTYTQKIINILINFLK